VRLARCGLCHTARPAGVSWRHRRLDMEFGGGRRFSATPFYDELDPDPAAPSAPKTDRELRGDIVVVSANITSDPSGIAFFDKEIFHQDDPKRSRSGYSALERRDALVPFSPPQR